MLGSKMMLFPLVLLVFVDLSTGAPSRTEKVSVKSKQTRVSHVDHFNPAGHVYAAEGQAEIPEADRRAEEARPSLSYDRPDYTYEAPSQPIKITQEYIPASIGTRTTTTFTQSQPTIVRKKTQTFTGPSQSFSSVSSRKPADSGFKLKKTVSVKSPSRPSNVISHFSPAGHIYEATGQAEIERQPVGSSSRFQLNQQQQSASPGIQTIQKVQTIRAPARLSTTKKTVVTQSAPQFSGSRFNLKKKVSVKSPSRQSSVINHFNPAGHIYEATGEAQIQGGPAQSGGSKDTVITNTYKAPPTFTQQTIRKDTFSRGSSRVVPAIVVQSSPSQSSGSNFKLEKIVSVKSPVRQSNVISHFTPAGHIYEAVGQAKIERKPTRVAISRPQESRDTQRYSQPRRTIVQKTVQKVVPSVSTQSESFKFVSNPSPKRPISSGFQVNKQVSVKSPSRATNVINHFNPAGHIYEATGDAQIRGGSLSGASSQVRVTQPTGGYIAPEKKIVKTIVRKTKLPSPAPLRTINSQRVQTFTQSAPKQRGPSGFKVEKTVSVKSPVRQSTVINHFTPAGHVYEATGQAKIERRPVSSSSSSFTQQKFVRPSVKVPAKKTVISDFDSFVQTSPKVEVSQQTYVAPSKPSTTVRKTTTFSVPRKSQFTQTIKSVEIPSGKPQSGFKVEKEVSVKSPVRNTNVIDFFNPAGHVYEAVGQATLERRPSGTSSAKVSTFQQNSQIIQSSRVPVKKVSVVNIASPPKIKVTQQSYVAPARKTTQTIRKTFATSPSRAQSSGVFQSSTKQSGGSKLTLDRTVSVKSPTRHSSVISHFTPAGHVYEAVGNARIVQGSSSSSLPSVKLSQQAQSYSAPRRTETIRKVQTVTAPKIQSSQVFKAVSKSAPRKPSLSSFQTKKTVVSQIPSSFGFTKKTEKVSYSPPRVQTTRITQSVPSSSFTQKKTQVFSASSSSGGSGFDVKKKVSVKSPTRVSSTINHFTPAGHVYEATGEARLQGKPVKASTSGVRVTSQSQSFSVPKVKVSSQTFSVPSKKTTTTTYSQPSRVQTSSIKTQSSPKRQQTSGFQVNKRVTVKNPARPSSAPSHFTPAGHVYEATGEAHLSGGSRVQETTVTKTRGEAKPKISSQGSSIYSESRGKPQNSIFIKVTEEVDDDSDEDSSEEFTGYDYSKPENVFASGDILGSYLPPSSDYAPPRDSFSAGLLPPAKK